MGELRGKQWEARQIAEWCYDAATNEPNEPGEPDWTDAKELAVAVCVCLSESQGRDRSYNDNVRNDVVVSRDVGLFQINIDARYIGTDVEENLYDPIRNIDAAHALYKRRGFQPWYGYTKGVYLRDSYVSRSVRGVANFLGDKLLAMPVPLLDGETEPYVHRFTTPILNYEFRLAGCLAHLKQGRKVLGWKAASVTTVGLVQTELAKGETLVKQTRPAG